MDGTVVIGTSINTKDFDAQIKYLERKLNDLESDFNDTDLGPKKGTYEYDKLNREIEITRNQLKGLYKQQEKYNQSIKETEMAGFNKIKDSVDSVGNSIENVTKKVTRWALAVFGVRTAYSAIRRVVNLVSSENEEVSNKIQQMRTVLANALLPIAQQVLNFIAKIMVYINYIFKVLTGKNLFDFASATKGASDSLSNGAKSSGAIANNLKEARKQLAGFDEMNVLSDNVASSGGGGGVGGIDASTFPNIFDSLKNVKIPKWLETLGDILKTLKQYWKELIIVVGSFALALAAIKIANFISQLLQFEGMTTRVKTALGLMVGGIVLLVSSIANLVLNWDNMTKKEKVITVMLAAVGAAFVALGYAIAAGISAATLGIGALIAGIVSLVTAIGTMVYSHDKEVKAARDEEEQTKLLAQAKRDAKLAYDDLINAVDRQTEAQKQLQEVEAKSGLIGKELYEQVENGTLTYQEMNETQREVYKAYKRLVEVNEAVTNAEKKKREEDSLAVKGEFDKKIYGDKNGVYCESYKDMKKEIVNAWKDGKLETKHATDSISLMMGTMGNKARETFAQDLPSDIKAGLNPGQYRTTFEKFKDVWDNWLSGLKRKIQVDFTVSTGTSGGGSRGFAKGGIIHHSLPKLAPGGIINQPGRGVPLGSAIGGERGAEGVIPLTDSQQMALLGEAIGRYITVNANIINTMNGRIISRELQKVQNESDFAYNR